MAPVAIVTALMLIEYFVFSALVGRARVTQDISAPATSGDPIFERYFRVHMNTLEMLVIVIPAMWLFAWYISVSIAAGLGLMFVIGRYLYLRGYVADPAKRSPGFIVSAAAEAVLLLGALFGAAMTYFV
ncbi:MAG: MAPEG family protein [Gammaproteobacteria bacterium]|nr:MAPEG family protein [Gammaproteobacteria bacterium]